MDQSVHLYECPTLPEQKCSWKGTREELRIHFPEHHPKLCLIRTYSPKYSTIPIQRYVPVKEYKQNYLLIFRNDTFLLQIKSDKKQEKFWCGIRYINVKDDTDTVVWKLNKRSHTQQKAIENFSFRVAFSSSDPDQMTQLVKKPGKMQPDNDWSFDTTSMVQCDLNSVVIENHIFSLCFYIYRQSELVHLEELFIKELACFLCKRLPPTVFLCQKGHPVCNSCKSNRCTFGRRNPCNCALTASKNVRYPCKNETIGCVVTGTQDQIQIHEKKCLRIPLCLGGDQKKKKKCEFSGSSYNWWCHLRNKHLDQTARPKEPFSYCLGKTPFKRSIFMLQYLVMFKISYQLDRSRDLSVWTCQQIGLKAGEKQQYSLEIQVLDSAGKQPNLMKRIKCCFQMEKEDEQNRDDCLKLPYSLLEPFIVDQNVTLMYDIIKEN